VWYTTTGNGRIFEVSACDELSADFETAIQVFTGDCEALDDECSTGIIAGSVSDDTCVDPFKLASKIQWDSVENEQYLIAVFGRNTASKGNFRTSLRDFIPPGVNQSAATPSPASLPTAAPTVAVLIPTAPPSDAPTAAPTTGTFYYPNITSNRSADCCTYCCTY